jgi:hypothetical protein
LIEQESRTLATATIKQLQRIGQELEEAVGRAWEALEQVIVESFDL